MQRIAPCSRTRLIVSIAVGLVVFVVQAISVWNTPLGDEPAKIKEVDALLEQFRRGLQTEGDLYKVQAQDGREINIFAHTAPTESRLPGLFDFTALTNEGEHKILVEIPEYNTSAEFPEKAEPTEIRAELRKRFPPLKVTVTRSWNDVKTASRGLIWSNGLILKAKAMQYLTANPDGSVESYEWTNRYALALQSFSVCTNAERIRRSVGFGLLVFVIFTPLMWLALLVLVWIWCFLRDRLRELSRAIRGQKRGE
jgi:hypothetical protein